MEMLALPEVARRFRTLDSPMKANSLYGSVLCVALLLTGCSRCPAAALPAEVPAVIVQRGPFQQLVRTTGNVVASAQAVIQPQVSGRIQQVMVDIGTEVDPGDVVAQLDSDAAQIAVLQARASPASAQAKLRTVQAGARAEEVTQAAETLAQQQAKLAAMQAGGRPEDVAAAHAAYDAQLAKLNVMQRGGRPEVVQQAQSLLDAAQQKLTLLEQGATVDVPPISRIFRTRWMGSNPR
jgi:HlyD family secretion protein